MPPALTAPLVLVRSVDCVNAGAARHLRSTTVLWLRLGLSGFVPFAVTTTYSYVGGTGGAAYLSGQATGTTVPMRS